MPAWPDVAGGRAQGPGPRPDREGGELEVHRQLSAHLRPGPGDAQIEPRRREANKLDEQ